MSEEVYLQNLTYERVHDNVGCVIGKLVFKNAMTYEEYVNILDKRYLTLSDNPQTENQQLKSTLEEIREYIKHEWFKRGQLGIIDKSFQEWELNNLLQIIDKGVNNE